MNQGDHNKELLMLHIQTVVPFMILDIIEGGGITERHIREAQYHVDTLACEGDAILYRDKKKGKTARVIHALCRGLAILAFCPGGVKFMGMHFEEKTGEALSALIDLLPLEDFRKLKEAMEAEEKREQDEQE